MSKWVKRVLSVVLVCVLVGGAVPLTSVTAVAFDGGSGAEASPYLISTAEQLDAVRNNLSAHYKMTADIDLASWGNWAPIGDNSTESSSSRFTGVFDGNGHVIKNMTVDIQGYLAHAGLFGYVEFGKIKNLGMINGNVNSNYFSGGIAGRVYASAVTNCYNTGAVSCSGTHTAYAGGIAGYGIRSVVSNCINSGTVSASSSYSYSSYSYAYSGGIVGYSSSSASNCYNTGVISAFSPSGSACVGGITGYNNSFSIINCYNAGAMNASSSSGNAYAGGMAGYGTEQSSLINNCYNTGAVNAPSASGSSFAGGIMGYVSYSSSSISNCYYLNNILDATGYFSDGTLTNVVALAKGEMMQQGSFVGFDFDTVWAIGSGKNNGYPYLRDVQSSVETTDTTLSLTNSAYSGAAGEQIIISGRFSSTTLTTASITWSCSDPAAVTFGEMSVVGTNEDAIISIPVTLNKAGVYTVMAYTTDGANAATTLNITGAETIFVMDDASGNLNETVTLDGTIIPYPALNLLSTDDSDYETLRALVYSIVWSHDGDNPDAIKFGDVNFGGFGPGFAVTMPLSLREEGSYKVTAAIPGGPSVTINVVVNDPWNNSLEIISGDGAYSAVWSDELFEPDPSSSSYAGSEEWHELALISAILSEKVYGVQLENIKLFDSLRAVGMVASEMDYKNITSTVGHPGYAFAHKTIERNGETKELVTAVFRGTENQSGLSDIITDFTQVTGGINQAAGFAYTSLDTYMTHWKIDKEDVVFYIIGHSLGGGMANCVANSLSDEYGESNVFGFTFASPKTSLQNFFPHDNISNFISENDFTPKLGPLWPVYGGVHFGRNYYVYTPISLNPWGACHAASSYIKGVAEMQGKGFMPGKYNMYSVLCPVDIEVYNSKNNLVGKITNNKVSDNTTIQACVDGDDKWFFLPANEKYTLKLVGTDTGTMDYIVYSYDFATEEVTATKAYTNVVLQDGKTFVSDAGGSIDVPDVQLFVTDDEGVQTALVNMDGTETLIEQKQYFKLWGKVTKWEKTPLNWFLLIICFGWIWMAF